MYENYAKLRDKYGLTDYKVAKESGVNKGTLSAWKNRQSQPSAIIIKKLADYFKVSTDYLINGESKENPTPQYWYDKETCEYAEELKNNKDLKLLMDSARNSKKEDIRAVYNMLELLKKKEKHDEN